MTIRKDFTIIKGSSFLKTLTIHPALLFLKRGTFSQSSTYSVNDIVVYLGDVYRCILDSVQILPTVVTNWEPVPVDDISSWTFSSVIKRMPTATETLSFDTGFLTDGVNGRVKMQLTPIQTSSLTRGEYNYSVTSDNGGIIVVHLIGKLNIID